MSNKKNTHYVPDSDGAIKRTLLVRNSINYDYTTTKNETTHKPSETVPDQTMGLREILLRYSRGLPVSGASVYFDGEADEDLPSEMAIDFKNLDLAEREELARQAADNVKNLRSTLQKTVDDGKRKKVEKDVQKSKSDTVDKKDKKPDQGRSDDGEAAPIS